MLALGTIQMGLFSKMNGNHARSAVQAELDELKERVQVLDKFCGVGLWQAVLHDGDAVHPKSRWTWSPEFRRLLGFQNEHDFPDAVNSWSDRLHPDDVEPTFKAFGAHLADRTGRTPYDAIYRLKMKDGSYRWFRATGGCARGPKGEPLRACGSLVDIHAQKVAEEAHKRGAEDQARIVHLLADGLGQLSNANMTFRLNETFPGEYEKLRQDFNSSMEKLQQAMQGFNASAQAISSGTDEISAAADDLSRRTEQQAASLEETAASLEQITSTVNMTAEGAKHARDVVSAAKSDAERSGTVVHSAIEAMSGIEKSSKQISQIIGVIDEIAFQTNLLALNAGVEAARAGDAGRGFAVVASEVRALAQRSAEAAKEIKGLISTSTEQVDQGVGLVKETGEALGRIVLQVAEINNVVSTIAASAQEQATGLRQVNTAVNQMDQVTQQNAAMVEETTAAAHSLTQETAELARLLGRFKIGESASAPAPRRKAQPVARPAMKKVAARGSSAAARKPAPAESTESWTEF